ncbi:MAG: DNA-binding response regulator [Dehalococcoidia bacterium]|nr:DNA-binding response regulator [Dehalococcoidia bacterium]
MQRSEREPTLTLFSSIPQRILLVGRLWDGLSDALVRLREQTNLHLLGPVDELNSESLREPGTALLFVAQDASNAALAALAREPDHPPKRPPLLLCLSPEALEGPNRFDLADDFVVIPCTAAEVAKRALRLIHKHRPAKPDQILNVGAVTLDPDGYQVTLEHRPVELAWMEFQLLKLMMQHPGTVFTREQLLAQVWGTEYFGGTRTVDVHIRRLRAKLGSHGENLFRTVQNVGYGVVEPS